MNKTAKPKPGVDNGAIAELKQPKSVERPSIEVSENVCVRIARNMFDNERVVDNVTMRDLIFQHIADAHGVDPSTIRGVELKLKLYQ